MATVLGGLLLLTATLPAASGAPQPTATEAAEPSQASVGERFLAALNRERERLELPLLRESEDLARAAQTHADDMVRKGYRALRSPDGLTIDDWVADTGYDARIVAEKVTSGWLRPEVLAASWAEFPDEHRGSVFHPEVLELGVGESRYGDTSLYVLVLALSQEDDRTAREGEAGAAQEATLEELAAEVAELEAARSRVVAAINRARREAGLAELRRVQLLDRVARELAEARAGGAEVEDPHTHGRQIVARLQYDRYAVRPVPGLEKLSSQGLLSAEGAVERWLGDEGYREVLFGQAFTDLGVGATLTPSGEVVWVALITRPKRF